MTPGNSMKCKVGQCLRKTQNSQASIILAYYRKFQVNFETLCYVIKQIMDDISKYKVNVGFRFSNLSLTPLQGASCMRATPILIWSLNP